MRDSHSRRCLVASLQTAVFAQGDIGALIYGRLISIVVVWKQHFFKLALILEDSLKKYTIKNINYNEMSP